VIESSKWASMKRKNMVISVCQIERSS